MTAYLLDADWAINALANKRQAAEILLRLTPQGVAISWVTVAELNEGAFGSPDPRAHLATLRTFVAPMRKLGLNVDIAERFAEIRSALRARGALIAAFDIVIAATALHYDLAVLTFNVRHLGRVPNLRLYQPTT